MGSRNQKYRIPSPPVLVGSDSIFQGLPIELLEEIYILSETFSLSFVCRLFYARLNIQHTRLRFCTRIFSPGNSSDLESDVVAFARKTEAVLRI